MDSRLQQIVRQKTQNLELCFETNVGSLTGANQAKIEKISIYRAIWLGFLCSQVSAIRCESKKSNWRREERLVDSRTVKMLRDLRLRAWGLEHPFAVENARAEVRARMHNGSLWCQGSSCPKGCVMARLKTRPAHKEPTEQNSTCGGGTHDCSVDSALFLAFTRQRDIKWS